MYSDTELTNIINLYEKRRNYNSKQSRKQQSANWYNENKTKKKDYYLRNKERISIQKKWNYAVKTTKQQKFIDKYPDQYQKYILPILTD
mgnify:CR=1 FL=1